MHDVPHPNPHLAQDDHTVNRAVTVLGRARQRVALENRLAAGMAIDETTPHWQLANETAQALEGEILRPDRRRALVTRAQRLGVRPFDANLVFALVQDRARRGETVSDAAAPLALLAERPRTPRFDAVPLVMLAAATGIAVGAAVFLVRWLVG
ncbi:MAG: hypothetical protein MK085_05470 [Phycisphaerales bacterium]|nr:hypothetical protein [Phycisphaerales bacterium]